MFVPGLLSLLTFFGAANAECFEPSPAFPPPKWHKHPGPWIPNGVFLGLEKAIRKIARTFPAETSFSIEITTGNETLWSKHHTAQESDVERPGVSRVDSNSQYRLASITKVFTTLGILYQHEAGNVSLDDSVDNYISGLASPSSGLIPWKDITLRMLASQLSGIPRDFAIGSALDIIEDPTKIGLPQPPPDFPLPCPELKNNGTCTRTDLLKALTHQAPVFAPNQKSTYSNDAFEILGLVLENVTRLSYSEYIQQAILEPLNMTMSSFEKPSDEHAVLPKGKNAWDWEEGVQRPTGGLFSTTADMSKFLRFILGNFNSIATGVNWLLPVSWGTGVTNFYGMPWEISRSDDILEHVRRPVTFVTKSGGLPGYYSRIILLPEYNLGVTFLLGSNVDVLEKLIEPTLTTLVRAAEAAVWTHINEDYTGRFVATHASLNSTLSVTSTLSKGLMISDFISNGSDMLHTVIPRYLYPGVGRNGVDWHAQLIPTLLYKNETAKRGEIWRILIVKDRPDEPTRPKMFEDWCVTDVDFMSYAGKPINEVVFWHEARNIELPAFDVVFEPKRERRGSDAGSPWFMGQVWQKIIV